MIESINFSALAAMLVAFAPVGGWVWHLSRQLAVADAKATTAAKNASDAAVTNAGLHIKLEQVQRDLAKHELYVAREYVSQATVQSLEEKLIKAIDRLGDRLDKALDRQNETAK